MQRGPADRRNQGQQRDVQIRVVTYVGASRPLRRRRPTAQLGSRWPARSDEAGWLSCVNTITAPRLSQRRLSARRTRLCLVARPLARSRVLSSLSDSPTAADADDRDVAEALASSETVPEAEAIAPRPRSESGDQTSAR